ncbi:unnamed protein product [Umbelopsis ramanniana]
MAEEQTTVKAQTTEELSAFVHFTNRSAELNEISSRIDDMEKSLGDLIENINSQGEPKRSGDN